MYLCVPVYACLQVLSLVSYVSYRSNIQILMLYESIFVYYLWSAGVTRYIINHDAIGIKYSEHIAVYYEWPAINTAVTHQTATIS